MRAKVIEEILNTERDYVRHLEDIIEVRTGRRKEGGREEREGVGKDGGGKGGRRKVGGRIDKRRKGGEGGREGGREEEEEEGRQKGQMLMAILSPQGFLKKCRENTKLFDHQKIETVFSNVEQVYLFQRDFLRDLESRVDHHRMEESQIGEVFVANVSGLWWWCRESVCGCLGSSV